MAFGLGEPSGVTHAETISYSGHEVTYTATVAGTYQITAYGASGGNSLDTGKTGGFGAEVGGTFTLTAGEVLTLVVGGSGLTGGYDGGGGGGSFVVGPGNTPLLIAGGAGAYAGSGVGGDSFNSGLNQFGVADFQSGNGEIDIITPAVVPEPASVVMLAIIASIWR